MFEVRWEFPGFEFGTIEISKHHKFLDKFDQKKKL